MIRSILVASLIILFSQLMTDSELWLSVLIGFITAIVLLFQEYFKTYIVDRAKSNWHKKEPITIDIENGGFGGKSESRRFFQAMIEEEISLLLNPLFSIS